MRTCMTASTRLLTLLTCLSIGPAQARPVISVEPQALEHYAYCVSQAKDRNSIFELDRYTMYRCFGDVATSYFNYLGRKHVGEYIVTEAAGVFVYRPISGVGKCWNKIVDAWGGPVSEFGCDIYIEI